MKWLARLVVSAILIANTACGPRNNSDDAAPEKPKEIGPNYAKDADPLILGSWLLYEKKSLGGDSQVTVYLSLEKDHLVVSGKFYKESRNVCNLSASSQKFFVTKDKIELFQNLEESTWYEYNSYTNVRKTCALEFPKGNHSYEFKSKDIFILKLENDKEPIFANRSKN